MAKRPARVIHHTATLVVRPNRHLDRPLVHPGAEDVPVAARVQRRRVDGQRALGQPLERHGRRLGVALEVGAQDIDAVVDVVPALVVDPAVRVEQGGVVPLGVEGAADRRQAVQVVEDDQADHVLVLVLFYWDVLGLVEELVGFFFGEADVIAVCQCHGW